MLKLNSQHGLSLIELMIVLVIVGILVAFAIVGLGKSPKNLDRQNIAREFKVYLERARFDSVKRRANVCDDMSRITIVNGTSFTVATDFNQNGRLDLPGEIRTIDFSSALDDVQIVGNGVSLPVTIRFDERGHSFLTDCVSTPPPNVPLFYFCNGTCTSSTVNAENSNVIFVSPTGTVAMMPGGSSMPTFDNPSVAGINANLQINPRLVNWTVVSPTPTPVPTATPAPTASPSPSVSPSVSPTPAPWCPISAPYQKPALTGCICGNPLASPPQWTRSSGFCK